MSAPRTLREVFDQGDLNKLGSAAKVQALGTTLGLGVSSVVLPVTAGIAVLPDGAKALAALGGFDRTNGVYLQATAPETVAGAGQITVTPAGDLSVDPACAEVEAAFVVAEGVVVSETIQVVGSVGTFLSGKRGKKVLGVVVDDGLVPGTKGVAARASVPALGTAALSADGSGVVFNAGDVVNGQATVRYVSTPAASAIQRLGSTVQF